MGTRKDSSTKIVVGNFTCPCGAQCGISLDDSGKPDGVVHALPMCRKYEALAVEDFLAYVRECAEKKRV